MWQDSCKNAQEENRQVQMWKWMKKNYFFKLKKEIWEKKFENFFLRKLKPRRDKMREKNWKGKWRRKRLVGRNEEPKWHAWTWAMAMLMFQPWPHWAKVKKQYLIQFAERRKACIEKKKGRCLVLSAKTRKVCA